jgi:hypothetical protein
MARHSIAGTAERVVYRVAGLPVAVSSLFRSAQAAASDPLRSAFACRYWHPQGPAEWLELIGGIVVTPLVVIFASLWFTFRNGAVVRARSGKGIAAQLGDQLRLYFSAGVLAPWYYIFSLYEEGGDERARGYIQRFETKPGIFPLLKRRRGSPLTDKARFAEYCRERGLRCVETLACVGGNMPDHALPECDLFVKPNNNRGGRGAERWDLVAPGVFSETGGQRLSAEALLARLVYGSRRQRLIVQPRMQTHPQLLDLTAGALPTVRLVTCLDERGEPELIGAVFRMSIGNNRTVDNLHAGGIAAAVDLRSGRLSRATNLGADARLGWLSLHPDTAAPIQGRTLPLWEDTKRLALAAHRHFADRVVIGWDIAATPDGPVIVEGNGNPDMDILQRFMREGLREHRFADLLAYHLLKRVPALSERLCASGDAVLHRAHEAGRIHPHERQADARGAGVGAQLPAEQPLAGELRGAHPARGGLSGAAADRTDAAPRRARARVGSR